MNHRCSCIAICNDHAHHWLAIQGDLVDVTGNNVGHDHRMAENRQKSQMGPECQEPFDSSLTCFLELQPTEYPRHSGVCNHFKRDTFVNLNMCKTTCSNKLYESYFDGEINIIIVARAAALL